MRKAIVVGAGINGLCAARALLARGWAVEVLERGPVPNPQAASHDRHRLIRPQYADPGYAARLPAAFRAWEDLWRDLGRSHYVERGVLSLCRAAGDAADQVRDTLAGTGAEVEILTPAEIAARFPMFEPEGVRYGLHAPRGGMLLADLILRDLAGWLRAAGVPIHERTPATHVDPATGAVTTPHGVFSGDVTILAAGVGLPALLPGLAADLEPRRVICIYIRPAQRWAEAWAAAPAWSGLGGDGDLWGMPRLGDIPMKLGAGAFSLPGDPATGREATPEDTAAVLGAYRGMFRDFAAFTPVRTEINFYMMAPDERFVLRRDGRVLALSADSGHGFKFGPLTGADLAEALEPCGFDAAAERLAGGLSRPAA